MVCGNWLRRFRLGDFVHMIHVLLQIGEPLEIEGWKQWHLLHAGLPKEQRCALNRAALTMKHASG